MELEATVTAYGGDRKKGFALFRKAADTEAALIYTEPPSYPRPVAEGLANAALALGDAKVAEDAYREALAREPGSGRAFFGLAAALQAQGRIVESRLAYERGLMKWDKADVDLFKRMPAAADGRAETVEARRFAGSRGFATLQVREPAARCRPRAVRRAKGWTELGMLARPNGRAPAARHRPREPAAAKRRIREPAAF